MSARESRGMLTINNIVQVCDEAPEMVFDEIQSLIDAAEYDIPDEAINASNVRKLQTLQAYYGNQYPYLVGLWGVLKWAKARDLPARIQMCDYLEKAASACSKKYDAASRLLTGYQFVADQNKGQRVF